MIKNYYLKCLYDTKKSFHNKAEVIEIKNEKRLFSYATLVCTIKKGKITILNCCSMTTRRHVNEFLQQNDLPTMTKKEMERAKTNEK